MLDEQSAALHAEQLSLAKAESSHKSASKELVALRESLDKTQAQMHSWIERATRAELRLEETTRKKRGD